MKKLKLLALIASLLSSKSFACTLEEASNTAQTAVVQLAREYKSSKIGITGLSSLNGIAEAHYIIFQPTVNGIQAGSDIIGSIVIDLNTCHQIDGSSGTFNLINVK